ncbi:hypothetical protein K402DRAFT_155002 [Aulographum hederae CBS 113979]|uniref:Uncharacterized protein n=1 Tax=Aulographum hederae CBS 113979 TaxID=1176131 RepID=A0A6G1GSV4_9PEZI|nr:hypothetical protein K402DRAFT_155002 [Aulographum hederae CBS 113979]
MRRQTCSGVGRIHAARDIVACQDYRLHRLLRLHRLHHLLRSILSWHCAFCYITTEYISHHDDISAWQDWVSIGTGVRI